MYFFKAEILNLAVCWCTSGLKWMQELNHVFTFTYVYIYVWRLGLDWMSCTQPFLCFQVFFFFFFLHFRICLHLLHLFRRILHLSLHFLGELPLTTDE